MFLTYYGTIKSTPIAILTGGEIRDISPQTIISLVFGGSKKQVQPTLKVSFLEYRRNWWLKFGEIVVIQGDYKILQL
jgi:hypothetical protein